MQTVFLNIDELNSFEFQPGERTEDKAMKEIMKSIQDKGLFMPILVDSKNNIIDGHRRVECYRRLGYTKIEAIVYSGTIPTIDIFSDINTVQRKMRSSELLKIYLNGGKIASKSFYNVIKFAEEKLGKAYIKKLYQEGLTPYYVQRVYPVACRCLMHEGERFRKFIDWAIKHSAFSEIMVFDKMKLPVESLKKNILADKGLKKKVSYR